MTGQTIPPRHTIQALRTDSRAQKSFPAGVTGTTASAGLMANYGYTSVRRNSLGTYSYLYRNQRYQENRSAVSAVVAATVATFDAVFITASGNALSPCNIATKSRVELIPSDSVAAS